VSSEGVVEGVEVRPGLLLARKCQPFVSPNVILKGLKTDGVMKKGNDIPRQLYTP
jgi:hypothetical protein